MQIRRVTVENFRGIRHAEWRLPDQRFLCLVGAGDSTKTTLIDAIALVMTTRTNVTFSDADFYGCDVSKPLVVRILIGNLTRALVNADTGFGMWLTGLTVDGELEHDPSPGSEPCVMLQLTADADLEPSWTVVRHGEYDDGLSLTAGRRRVLGMFRVDERVDGHLRWGRGSALARITEGGTDAAVTAVRRAARDTIFNNGAAPLQETASNVATAAAAIGGGDFAGLRPGWDPAAAASPSALLLHDGLVPLTSAGLGTRRLVSIAAQELATQEGNLLLVDEIEHGLEPHRLLHVLHELRKRSDSRQGQVIVTTHSPVAIQAMTAADILVVRRSVDGVTTVTPVPADLDAAQGALRAGPSALLARRVVVGEGKTEIGMLRALIRHWNAERIATGSTTHAAVGATFVNGDGTSAAIRAKIYHELGVAAALLMDHDDRGVDEHVKAAEAAGVLVARWQLGNSTEAELLSTVDEADLLAILALAIYHKGAEAVHAHLRTQLDKLPKDSDPCVPEAWAAGGYQLSDVRAAVVKAASGKDKEWFKREDAGESLGTFVYKRWSHYADTYLGAELSKVRRFIYGEEFTDSSAG